MVQDSKVYWFCENENSVKTVGHESNFQEFIVKKFQEFIVKK
jgi:hypothetical protein